MPRIKWKPSPTYGLEYDVTNYVAKAKAQQDAIDALSEDEARLVHDYGYDYATLLLRLGRGVRHARKVAEAERGKPIVRRKRY